MNSTLFSLCASGCASVSNLFIRKNSIPNESSSGHLAIHYLISFFLCFLLCTGLWSFSINYPMLCVGAAVGICNVVLMLFTMKAIQNGPSGLIFSFHAASLVFPGLLLFFVFGKEFGFAFSISQAIGISLVLGGLYLATKGGTDSAEPQQAISKKWLLCAFGCFFVQMLAFTLIQWRCLFFLQDRPDHLLIPARIHESEDIWFMPGLFGAAFIFQMLVFFWEKRNFRFSDMKYGLLSGSANSGSTYFLAIATKFALPIEKAILFPCFAVGTILLCNAWASKMYNEKFHLKANILCSLGILIGSMRF